MSARIRDLIVETERWLVEHRSRNDYIQAAACAIRLKALRDCLKIAEAA